MREKQIEQKLVRAVRAAGGLCPKFVSPGLAGMPDRLILLPGGRFAFVEVKAPGEKPRALQLHRHAQLRALGFSVFVLDDPARVPVILDHTQRSWEQLACCEPGRVEGKRPSGRLQGQWAQQI